MCKRLSVLMCCVFILSTIWNTSFGQSSLFYTGGGHSLSRANTGTMFTGIESIYTNPAGLVSIENYGVDVSYDRRYNLSELETVSLGAAKKIGNSAVGVSVARFGYSAYSESKIGMTYARKLFDNLNIGGSFNYLRFDSGEYGSTGKFTFDLGVQSSINKNLSIGAYVFSPGSVSITDDLDVPSRISIGLRYKTGNKVDLYLDISKTIDRSPEFKFSVDYSLVEQVALRAGANITQSSIHFGPAFKLKSGLSIFGGYSYDNRLGHTTGLSISYVK